MMNVKNILIFTDKLCDYCPFISTATNLIDLFQKYVVIPGLKSQTIENNHYYKYLNQKSMFRCVVLSVPILGNVLVAILDFLNIMRLKYLVNYKPTLSLIRSQADGRRAVLAAVKKNGLALPLSLIKSQTRGRQAVLAAIKKNGLALQYVSPNLQSDRNVVLDAVRQNGFALEFAHMNLYNDEEIVRAAVKQNGLALQYAGLDLRSDRNIVLEAINQNGFALDYASSDLRNDKEMLAAVETYNQSLTDLALACNPGLRGDRKAVLTAVKQNGFNLLFADPDLQKDREIALEAFRQDGEVYCYIYEGMLPEELGNDPELARIVVRQKGEMLKFVSSKLKKDKDVVLDAIRRDQSAVQYIHQGAREHEEINATYMKYYNMR